MLCPAKCNPDLTVQGFDQDVIDDKVFFAKGPLQMPVLVIGGAELVGPDDGDRDALNSYNVQETVIPDPDTG